jgi:purine-binding chemotaxis protein CheW
MGSDTAASGARQRSQSSGGEIDGKGGKFLTFFLAGEEYGLEILKVHEIIGMMPITSVPRTPQFVRGVINLRGKVIPVVDLRLKLEMDSAEQTEETCIIVVQASGLETGVIVDKVSEVLDIASDDIDETLSFGTSVNSDYILGIGKSEGRVKLLLDIDKVLVVSDIATLSAVTENSSEVDEEVSLAKAA